MCYILPGLSSSTTSIGVETTGRLGIPAPFVAFIIT